MEIDGQWLTQLLTALGVVITALVSLWNAWQGKKLADKVDETSIELKAMRGPKPKRRRRRR